MLGFLIPILTFPGVIVHEYAHYKMCHWREVPVHEVVFFQLGNPAGYVVHGEPDRYADALAISGAPFLINSALAIVLFIASFGTVMVVAGDGGIASIFTGLLTWLGISVGMHAIPSSGDAASLWTLAKRHWRDSVLGLLGFPIAALIYVANLLNFLWFDLIYAALLLFITAGVMGLL